MAFDERLAIEPIGRRRRRGIRGEWFTCSKCGKGPYPVSEARKGSLCGNCVSEYWRDWSHKNRDKIKASRRRRAAARRQMEAWKDEVLYQLAVDDPQRFVELWEKVTGGAPVDASLARRQGSRCCQPPGPSHPTGGRRFTSHADAGAAQGARLREEQP